MPFQNRVTPFGEIVVSAERGTMMGNRGVLHDDNKLIVLDWAHKGWITCQLKHGRRRREIMRSGSYSELFFLDETTAFSAGHRPCFDCQEQRAYEFRKSWFKANAGKHPGMRYSIAEIDRVLHRERINRKGEKVTFTAKASSLPDGTFILYAGKYYLKLKTYYLEWTHAGYVSHTTLPENSEVTVLTPKSIVRCFAGGFEPFVHHSAILCITALYFPERGKYHQMALNLN